MSSEGSTFQQSMHTITDAYTYIMRHAKASMGVWNKSFPDAVRMQVINFTFERFPITNACAPLITAHQQGRGKTKVKMTNIKICDVLTSAQRQSNF